MTDILPDVRPVTPRSPLINFIIILVIALIVLGGLLGFNFAHMQNITADNAEEKSQLVNLQKQITENNLALKQVLQAKDVQGENIANLQKTLVELQQMTVKNRRYWLVSEVKYLVNLASYTLAFQRDVVGTASLLQAAISDLEQLSGADIVNVRKALMQDVATLQKKKVIDVSGSFIQLTLLDHLIDQMPLIGSQYEAAKEAPINITKDAGGWKQALRANLAKVSSMIVIRRDEDAIKPIVIQENKKAIYQYLHLSVAQAQWALLRQQPDIYDASLQQVLQWSHRYFIVSDKNSEEMFDKLQQLQQPWPQTPSNIHASLQVVNALEG